MQDHISRIGITVSAVESVQFEGPPETPAVSGAHAVAAQRCTAAAHLIIIPSSLEPVLVAIAMRHQSRSHHGIAQQIINEEAVAARRQAHVDKKTEAFVETLARYKGAGRCRMKTNIFSDDGLSRCGHLVQ